MRSTSIIAQLRVLEPKRQVSCGPWPLAASRVSDPDQLLQDNLTTFGKMGSKMKCNTKICATKKISGKTIRSETGICHVVFKMLRIMRTRHEERVP